MSTQKSVVIAGASGVVGGRVLKQLLEHPDVSRVTAVGRKQLQQKHPKLVSTVADLHNAGSIGRVAPDDVAVAFCCLGTTMKAAGSKEAFRAVDYGAVVAFATAMKDKGATRFVLLTSTGASTKSGNFYLKTKGEAEDAVESLGFTSFVTLRPSFLDDEGGRKEQRTGEQLALPVARLVFSIVGKHHRLAPITIDVVARAMVRLGFDDANEKVRVVESDKLHAIGEP
ncbi:MAG: NAD(P)H-binding protein [Deltaproteobacteria bacterium]|nr:NAD(P)H-binding protein [Deltaproteobacteria bacterium]